MATYELSLPVIRPIETTIETRETSLFWIYKYNEKCRYDSIATVGESRDAAFNLIIY